jgi:hypothetical protein
VLNAALSNQTTGSYNIAIGSGAISQFVGACSNNVAVGHSALQSTSGSTNTAIGYNSGSAMTSGSKNTILGLYSGNQSGLDIRTASNNVVLSDGDGNPFVYWNSPSFGVRYDYSTGDAGLFYLPTSTRSFTNNGGSGITAIQSGTINTGFIHVIETGTTKYFIGVYYKTDANDPVVTAIASNGLSVGATNFQGTVVFNGATNNANVKMRAIAYNVGFGM